MTEIYRDLNFRVNGTMVKVIPKTSLSAINDGAGRNIVSTYALKSELSDGTVSKIGTATLGSTDTPVYLKNGVPTVCSQLALKTALSDGSVTKLGTADVGSTSKPIYLNKGVPTVATDVLDTTTNLQVSAPKLFSSGGTTPLQGNLTGNAPGVLVKNTSYSKDDGVIRYYSGMYVCDKDGNSRGGWYPYQNADGSTKIIFRTRDSNNVLKEITLDPLFGTTDTLATLKYVSDALAAYGCARLDTANTYSQTNTFNGNLNANSLNSLTHGIIRVYGRNATTGWRRVLKLPPSTVYFDGRIVLLSYGYVDFFYTGTVLRYSRHALNKNDCPDGFLKMAKDSDGYSYLFIYVSTNHHYDVIPRGLRTGIWAYGTLADIDTSICTSAKEDEPTTDTWASVIDSQAFEVDE